MNIYEAIAQQQEGKPILEMHLGEGGKVIRVWTDTLDNAIENRIWLKDSDRAKQWYIHLLKTMVFELPPETSFVGGGSNATF